MTVLPYWLRQMKGAEKRAATFRKKAATSRDPQWCLNMAHGAEKDASKCFKRWRSKNPTADNPLLGKDAL